MLSVGTQIKQTGVEMRTDSPVWEKGFTFLVSNPGNDSLQLKIMDQKTEKEIGRLTYNLSVLLESKFLQVVSQPFPLQRSGAESKVTMSLVLRILKKAPILTGDEAIAQYSDEYQIRTTDETPVPPLRKQTSKFSTNSQSIDNNSDSGIPMDEQFIISSTVTSTLSSEPALTAPASDDSDYSNSNLIHRTPSTTSSSGTAGLGRIQLTLRYSVQRQRLVVIVHKIM